MLKYIYKYVKSVVIYCFLMYNYYLVIISNFGWCICDRQASCKKALSWIFLPSPAFHSFPADSTQSSAEFLTMHLAYKIIQKSFKNGHLAICILDLYLGFYFTIFLFEILSHIVLLFIDVSFPSVLLFFTIKSLTF